MGRQPKPAYLKQNKLILVRLTASEHATIYRAAHRAKSPAATYVRQLALAHAKRGTATS